MFAHPKRFLTVAALAAGFASAAFAQNTITVATGSADGTYHKMQTEALRLCSSTDLTFKLVITKGSSDNVSQLLANQVNAIWTQSDVLVLASRDDDFSDVKTLLAMHPEEVHAVALAAPGKSKGLFGKEVPALTSMSDLTSDRIVGAAGGSYDTARLILSNAGFKFTLRGQKYADNAALLLALKAREIDVAILVGGAPFKAVSDLNTEFRLLGFPDAAQKALVATGGYKPAKVSYDNLGQQGVPTVTTEALLVTRQYTVPKVVNALAEFRSCVLNGLPELRQTLNNHPKWRAVKADNKGRWPWYDLPQVKSK